MAAGVNLLLSSKTAVKITQLQVSPDCAPSLLGMHCGMGRDTDNSIVHMRAQALSPAGRCKTFDAAADGYGRGEAVAVLLLSKLAEAAPLAIIQVGLVCECRV